MKKWHFNLFITVIIISSVLMLASLKSSYSTLIESRNGIVEIENFELNSVKDNFKEKIIEGKKEEKFVYTANIDSSVFNNIGGQLVVYISKINGNYHEIYFNSALIGNIGVRNSKFNNSLAISRKFSLDSALILDGDNELKIVTYSDFKIGNTGFPVLLGNDAKIEEIFFKRTLSLKIFFFFLIGALLLILIAQFITFIFNRKETKKYLFMIPANIFLIIKLLDLIVEYHDKIDSYDWLKITDISLFTSVSIFNAGLLCFYKRKTKVKLIIPLYGFPAMIYWIATTYSQLIIYRYILIASVLVQIYLCLDTCIREYQKDRKKLRNYISISAYIILIFSGLLDLLFNSFLAEKSIHFMLAGTVFFSISIFLFSLDKFLNDERKIVISKEVLDMEKKRLKTALITDELTGFYNHRKFFEVFKDLQSKNIDKIDLIMIDIDKFRPINEIHGHSTGDRVVQEIARIFKLSFPDNKLIFRYGGKKFMIINTRKEISSEEFANLIKNRVKNSKRIRALVDFLPLTVSVGLSSYPKDANSVSKLVSQCENAISFSKQKGGNKVTKFDSRISEKVEENKVFKFRDKMLLDFIYTLASVIDLKDAYTGRHSEEVSNYAYMIAERLGLSEKEKYAVKLGGILHDFGKIAISDSIIRKTEKLTDDEYNAIKSHPLIGYDIVKKVISDELVLACIRSHHERLDGRGYPDGLKGEEIPFVARIVCVADSYHAMISTRSYRKSQEDDYAISELVKGKGTQFDPRVVDAFLQVIGVS